MDLSFEEFCGCLFVHQSDSKLYGRLKRNYHNAFLMGDNKSSNKILEYKNMIEYCQGPYSTQPEPIENKEEDGCVAFIEQGQNDVVNKSPREKCHGCTMVNNHFLSD